MAHSRLPLAAIVDLHVLDTIVDDGAGFEIRNHFAVLVSVYFIVDSEVLESLAVEGEEVLHREFILAALRVEVVVVVELLENGDEPVEVAVRETAVVCVDCSSRAAKALSGSDLGTIGECPKSTLHQSIRKLLDNDAIDKVMLPSPVDPRGDHRPEVLESAV